MTPQKRRDEQTKKGMMAKKEPLIHYSGGLEIRNRRGGLRVSLPGWAACCTGEKCEAIRRDGNQTRDPGAVTCRACIRQIEAEEDAPTAEEIAAARAAGTLPVPVRAPLTDAERQERRKRGGW